MIIDLVTRDGNAGVNDDNTTVDSPGMLPYFRLSRSVGTRVALFTFKTHMAGFVWDAAQLKTTHTYVEVKTLLDGVTVGGHKVSDTEQVINWRTAAES
jgi:hypothetical protein